jgi:hypothetical protein
MKKLLSVIIMLCLFGTMSFAKQNEMENRDPSNEIELSEELYNIGKIDVSSKGNPEEITNGKNSSIKNSTNEYDGYSLSWRNIGDMFVLEGIDNGFVSAKYQYDSNGNRKLKDISGETIEYVYEGSFLVKEISDSNQINYLYENYYRDEDYKILVGVIINGKAFKYSFDEAGLIVGLIDENNNMVVKYQYDNNGALTETYVVSDGKLMDAKEKPDEIGLLNNIVGLSQYLDKETGWYYKFGRYFNPNTNLFIPTPVVSKDFPDIGTKDIYSDLYYQAIAMSNSLLNSGTHGRPISHSSSWYSDLSEVEVLARLIFGEASNNINQVRGVGWVVVTRTESSGFRNTFREVALQPSQFEAMTGSQAHFTQQARQPDLNSQRWKDATEMACFIVVSDNSNDLSGVVGRPSGYTNQCYFLSRGYFDLSSNTRNHSPVISSATPYSNGTAEYYINGGWHPIININSLGDARGNVFFNYE